jgi:hypothetical protein
MLLLFGSVHSQNHDLITGNPEDQLNLENNYEVPYALIESQMDLVRHPIQLNLATITQLTESGLFTPFQAYNIIQYREKFGPLLSVYELAGIDGFHLTHLKGIERFLMVDPLRPIHVNQGGQNMILLGLGVGFPLPSGYNNMYIGNRQKMVMRIKTNMERRISAGLSYEKDAGEKYFNSPTPEYISGYIQFRGDKLIRRLVAGNYRLQHGLGLVNGSGFMHPLAELGIKGGFMNRIIPYSSMNEYIAHRGMATRLKLGNFSLMAWFSHKNIDISDSSLPDDFNGIDWLVYQRKSGTHRTSMENSSRALAYRTNSGIQFIFSRNGFSAGVLSEVEFNNLTRRGLERWGEKGTGFRHQVLAVHWQWKAGSWETFGEVSAGDRLSWAALAGIRYLFSDFAQGTMLLHSYDKDYRGMHPSSYSWGNAISNENGLAFHLHLEPGNTLVADFEAELFQHPSNKYRTIVPSSGSRLKLTLRNPGNKSFQWRIRVAQKNWQITPFSNLTGLRQIRSTRVNRLDSRFIYRPWKAFSWQTRLVISASDGEEDTRDKIGYAAVQQLGFHGRKNLKAQVQMVVFRINQWENRIYLYEPGLYYEFNFPAYDGQGQKITATLSGNLGSNLILSGKISGSVYHDRKNIGTGPDLTEGNLRWNTGLQLRLKL